MNLLLTESSPQEPVCKGRVYRGNVNTYFSSHGSVEVRKSLRFLKSMSCPGCEKCGWEEDTIREEIANEYYQEDWLKDIEHGKTYQLQIDGGRDFETGCYEIDDVYFKEVKTWTK